MTDGQLIKNFNDIKRLLIEQSTCLKAIGLKTGALVLQDQPKSKPEGITKADMTPDELQYLKKWEDQCDSEMDGQIVGNITPDQQHYLDTVLALKSANQNNRHHKEVLTPKAVWEIQPNESYKDYAMRAISTAIDRDALKTYGNDERLYTLNEVAQMIAEAREDTIAAERTLNNV